MRKGKKGNSKIMDTIYEEVIFEMCNRETCRASHMAIISMLNFYKRILGKKKTKRICKEK